MAVSLVNPKSSSSSKLGNWKAEEFNKFAIVAPVVLAGIVPKQVYACFMILMRMYSIVYSHYLRYCGWQQNTSTTSVSCCGNMQSCMRSCIATLHVQRTRICTAPARRYQAPQTITGAMCMKAW